MSSMEERPQSAIPYLKRAAIVKSRDEVSRDLPQEMARRTPRVEQEEADIM